MDDVLTRISEVFGCWGAGTTLDEMREGFAQLVSGGRRPSAMRAVDAGGVPGAWIGDETAERVVLYCHGGGYQMGSILSHGDLMQRLADESGAKVFGFDYRLAPEHRYPAALEDAVTVYHWLMDNGVRPEKLAIAGDSAGAGLALAMMLKLREWGSPMPAAAVFLSPWLDLQARSATYETMAALDPLTQRDKVLRMARTYLGKLGDLTDPLASPIEGDLAGMPPVLVHVGGSETVLGDSEMLLDRAAQAGTDVKVEIWPGMIHHFQVFPELVEAGQSIRQIGAYLREKLL
jgi:epsilon-lactone hydrolase